jgi:hypothetical protein
VGEWTCMCVCVNGHVGRDEIFLFLPLILQRGLLFFWNSFFSIMRVFIQSYNIT